MSIRSGARWRLVRRALATGAAGVLLGAVAPVTPAHAEVPVLVLDGTGWGHGVGLAQWGAEFMARSGRSADEILMTFYPGAQLGQASGPVRVAVHKPPSSTTTLSFPGGGEVRSAVTGAQAPGFPVRVGQGGRVRITFDGSYRVEALVGAMGATAATRYQQEPCPLLVVCGTPTTQPAPSATTTTTAPTTTTTRPPSGSGGGSGGGPGTSAPPSGSGGASSSGPVWAVPAEGSATTVDDRGRSYRGVIEATGAGALRLVNHLGVEDYLRGMAEVPGTWPAAAVQAQTVAARTYALRAMRSGGELCDDARCQVYVGRTAESRGQDEAVMNTASKVVTFNGALAAAVYSADAGGVSATTVEGFGTPDGVYPYLTTVRYDTDNPLPWKLEVSLADVASRLRYAGSITGVRIGTSGPSGRVLDMVLSGSAGDVSVDGLTFARSLGLRSTKLAARVGSAASAPPPPPPAEEAIQALPEQATKIARSAARPVSAAQIDRRASLVDARLRIDPVEALDPRRSLLVLSAAVVLAGLTGAGLPLLGAHPELVTGVVGRLRGARPWSRWRFLNRDR